MPNHCGNELTITGPTHDLQAFAVKAVGPKHRYADSKSIKEQVDSPLSFHCLVPIPKNILSLSYDPHGYDMETELWGVKWGAIGKVTKVATEVELFYRFSTAWAPPIVFIRRVSMLFPNLVFNLNYEEDGCDVFGRIEIQNGVTLRKIDWPGMGADIDFRRQLLIVPNGLLCLNLISNRTGYSPTTVDKSRLREIGTRIRSRFESVSRIAGRLQDDGWSCSMNDFQMVWHHKEYRSRDEMENRLEKLGVDWKIEFNEAAAIKL